MERRLKRFGATTKRVAKQQDARNVDQRFAPVIASFAGFPDVAQKRMFASNSVLSVDGKIFAMMVRGKFVAKLPGDRVAELIQRGLGDHFDPGHGRLMKEWIALAGDRPDWVELAAEAYRFVKAATKPPARRRPAKTRVTD